jgi:hypothetical protein
LPAAQPPSLALGIGAAGFDFIREPATGFIWSAAQQQRQILPT